MARLKITARPIGSEDIEASEDEIRQLSEGEEDLTNLTQMGPVRPVQALQSELGDIF